GTGTLAVVTSQGEPTAADGTSPSGDPPQVYSPPGTAGEEARGALWIFDVKGNLVALLDHGGNKLFFDLTTRQFFSESDEQAKVFAGPSPYEDLPLAQATPEPVTPFAPPTPVATPISTAYP